MAKKEARHSVWSENQPDPIGPAARRLRDAGHDRFRTHAYTRNNTQSWLDAARDDATGLWTVVHNDRLPTGGRFQDILFAKPVSFFDALHCCAAFEALPGHGEPETLPEGAVHFRAVAEAADIPFDEDGLPHPAVNGVILASGALFGPEADAAAARTAGKPLPPDIIPAAVESAFVMKTLVPARVRPLPAAEEDIVATALQRKQDERDVASRQAPYRKVQEEAESLRNFYNESVHCEAGALHLGPYVKRMSCGLTGASLAAGALLNAGPDVMFFFAPLMSICIGSMAGMSANVIANKRRNPRQAAFEKAVRHLPEGPEKKLAQDFARAARAAYSLGYVSRLQTYLAKAGASRGRLEKTRDRALALIESAGQQAGLGENDRARLKQAFREGAFPDSEQIFQTFDGHYRQFIEALDRKVKSIRPSLSLTS